MFRTSGYEFNHSWSLGISPSCPLSAAPTVAVAPPRSSHPAVAWPCICFQVKMLFEFGGFVSFSLSEERPTRPTIVVDSDESEKGRRRRIGEADDDNDESEKPTTTTNLKLFMK
ncbi:hypothetical protein LWI29_029434 [Acer saccharum]|uniref:Uncharacterized protein n=1 Tax=Acer saccharum TaxID=4024 RepID=A0AA39VT95_ACESA|nr:hypothetical protein LWI29_029434 [Acer saccharum]